MKRKRVAIAQTLVFTASYLLNLHTSSTTPGQEQDKVIVFLVTSLYRIRRIEEGETDLIDTIITLDEEPNLNKNVETKVHFLYQVPL